MEASLNGGAVPENQVYSSLTGGSAKFDLRSCLAQTGCNVMLMDNESQHDAHRATAGRETPHIGTKVAPSLSLNLRWLAPFAGSVAVRPGLALSCAAPLQHGTAQKPRDAAVQKRKSLELDMLPGPTDLTVSTST